jgi:hypothetical protein
MEFSLHLPLSVKMQGNEVEAVKTPTVRSWEIYFVSIISRAILHKYVQRILSYFE